MRRPIPLLLIALASVGTAEKRDDLIALYNYDPAVPLDIHRSEVPSREGYRVAEISFALPKAGRMSGFLVTPSTNAKKPAIIWMHSNGATAFLGNAVLMAKAGAVSLLVGEAEGLPGGTAEQARDQLIADVVGLRRAVDVLLSDDDIDSSRIAIVGHSSGAMMAAVAASIDKRFSAAVYEVGLLGMSIHIATSPGAWAQGVRKELGEHLAHFLEIVSVVDDKNYIDQAPVVPKLFQSAWYDPGVPRKDAEDFFNAASKPKEMKWYDCGHDMDDPKAITDRVHFLAKHLRLRHIDAVLSGQPSEAR